MHREDIKYIIIWFISNEATLGETVSLKFVTKLVIE